MSDTIKLIFACVLGGVAIPGIIGAVLGAMAGPFIGFVYAYKWLLQLFGIIP